MPSCALAAIHAAGQGVDKNEIKHGKKGSYLYRRILEHPYLGDGSCRGLNLNMYNRKFL
jgi:hypothetical protein